jgi:predicted CxxxxCH...CXXCH cytochrome family protein
MKKKLFASIVIISGLTFPSVCFAAFGDTPCQDCHSWNDCESPKAECGSCHALPPATGTHLAHFDGIDSSLSYGDIRTTEDFIMGQASDTNMIGCGNCHPMDATSHGNGTWGDIELWNAAAPQDSLKALSDTGSYDPATGTCSNVYCHSANKWTTDGTVPMPWPEVTGWVKNVDPLPRPLPDNIITERVYQDVTWNSGETLTCDGCHGNSPQTSYVDNDGGAGDSHYWVDDFGYEDGHVWNHGLPAIGCITCHNDTVKEPSTTGIDPTTSRRFYNDVAIYDKAKHVNGTVDVAFDTANPYTYTTWAGTKIYDFTNSSYDTASKTCSNVGCHKTETAVTWGLPYRYWDSIECNPAKK